jgi:uncharacterized protein (DUF1330 family)
MIYILQLVYVKEGQEKIFHQFEDVVMPMISKHNGQLLLRVRPNNDAIIEKSIESPYEIHLVQFNSEKDFISFSQDEERKKFLHLKDQSVESILLIKGTRL